MRRSESVKATYDGVVRLPWSFAIISTLIRERKLKSHAINNPPSRLIRTNGQTDDGHSTDGSGTVEKGGLEGWKEERSKAFGKPSIHPSIRPSIRPSVVVAAETGAFRGDSQRTHASVASFARFRLSSRPLAVARVENAFFVSKTPRVDGTAGAARKTRRKSGSFATPERRRGAARGETRGFERVKIHSIATLRRHRRARRRRGSIRRARLLHPSFPRKDETRSASSSRRRIVVVAVPVVLPDTDARVRRAQIDANGGSVSLTHVCLCVCVVTSMCVAICRPVPRARRNRRRPRKDSFDDFDESRTVNSSTTPPAAASVSTVAEEASIVLLRRLFGYSDIRTVRIVCVSSARAGCPSKLLDASFETLLPLHRVVVLVFKKSVGTG